MALFDRMERRMSATVDRVNAIPFVLTTMQSTPNGRAKPDAQRLSIKGKGIFDYVSVDFGLQLGVRKLSSDANDLRSLMSGREPQLSIDRKYFPLSSDEPKQGDHISFPTRPALPDFHVVSSQRDGMSRMVLVLVQLSGQV